MSATGWNVDIPTAEYYGPLPDHWHGRVFPRDIHPLIREIEDCPEVAIDTETTGLTVWKDIPLYFSLAWGRRRATLHASLLPCLANAFADHRKDWIFANAKYDAHMLGNYPLFPVHIAGNFVDTQVMHALLYEEQPHGLKEMARGLLGWKWSDFQDTFGKITKLFSPTMLIQKAEQDNFPLLVEYAANDAWGTLNVYHKLKKELEAARTYSLFYDKPPYIATLYDLFRKVEMPFTKVLWKNERNGILVNIPYLQGIAPQALAEIARCERDITQLAGKPINPASTPDLRWYFLEHMQYKPLKMTKGGASGVRNASVDKGFLEHYSDKGDKMASLVLEHRSLKKLHGTYIVGLSELADPRGRIHTRFNQDVARTGRLSSADPNLQNIPNVEKDKWKMRGAFIAPPGRKLIVADYSQLEMRLLACAAMEPDMIGIFAKKWDIHMGNASLVFGFPYDDIKAAKDIEKKVKQHKLPETDLTPYLLDCLHARGAAKSIGFGLNYGMGEEKLANSIGVSLAEARQKIEQYKATYPAVKQFYANAIQETVNTGYAFTIMGRRRNLPEILSANRGERSKAERQAVNLPIQGSAADVVKMAQVLLDMCGLDKSHDCHSLLQVHDELVHEAPAEVAEYCRDQIIDIMEHPFFVDLPVALTVDAGIGDTWLEAK